MASIQEMKAAADALKAALDVLVGKVANLEAAYGGLKNSGGLSADAQAVLDAAVDELGAARSEAEQAAGDVDGALA